MERGTLSFFEIRSRDETSIADTDVALAVGHLPLLAWVHETRDPPQSHEALCNFSRQSAVCKRYSAIQTARHTFVAAWYI
jgi:hypothetical protein